MHLLSTLRERIERADALVMDLAGHNPNVMIEVGMAVAMYKGESGGLIILKPKNEPWPSNLQGMVYCNYDKSLRRGLEDQAGFRAALRTRILKVAKDRQMLRSEADASWNHPPDVGDLSISHDLELWHTRPNDKDSATHSAISHKSERLSF